jgi:hypothetical protein
LIRVNPGGGLALALLVVVCNDIVMHGSDTLLRDRMLALFLDRASQ